jgi:two-component system nitrogen regulation sensor histidine kinase NtrY
LDGLTRAFAQMTEQLAQARRTVESSMAQVNLARSHLQTMLDNLTAGVVLLDTQGHILSINPGATRILQLPLAVHLGKTLTDIEGLQLFGRQVMEQFHEFASEQQRSLDHWQQSFEIDTKTQQNFVEFGPDRQLHTTLVARGAVLPQGEWLLVFDDITEIVSAQRTQAWSEVARRLAHEIKNPLTPIKLSAQRLEKKFGAQIQDPVFSSCIGMIIRQTDDLKRLVNEFSNFARLPQTRPVMGSMAKTIEEAVTVFQVAHKDLQIAVDQDSSLPEFRFDPDQIKRVLINLLDNAVAAVSDVQEPRVSVRTQYDGLLKLVRISINDNGIGIPQQDRDRVFEPYFSTKESGTGLGLAIVRRIVEDHNGFIRALQNEPQGTRILVELPVAEADATTSSRSNIVQRS